jgi:hypothetical protein
MGQLDYEKQQIPVKYQKLDQLIKNSKFKNS